MLRILMALFSSFVQIDLPVYGNTDLGYYYVILEVGEQKQSKSLILDTGSHLTVFPCKGCANCGTHDSPYFDFQKSSSFEQLSSKVSYFDWICGGKSDSCLFSQTYVEGSEYRGFFGIDQIWVDDKTMFKTIVGCALKETGDFLQQQADGILGLSNDKKSNANSPPFLIDILRQQKFTTQSGFGLCLSEKGGSFHLRKLPDNEDTVIIDCTETQWGVFYKLPLTGITMGGKKINYNFDRLKEDNEWVNLDTGTTFVYFNQGMMNLFIKQIDDYCQQQEDNCGGYEYYQQCYLFNENKYSLEEFMKSFPLIEFQFYENTIKWYPFDYMVRPLGY